MRLVFVTQTLDPQHAALAQTLDLVRVLAARIDELEVVTRTSHWDDVPANCVVRTFEARSRARRAWAFERALLPALRHADGVLVHMVPEFALLAAPVARAQTHPGAALVHALARGRRAQARDAHDERRPQRRRGELPDRHPEVTADRPRDRRRCVRRAAAGGARRPAEAARARDGRLAGRGSPRCSTRSFCLDGVEVELEICGPSLTPDEAAHRRELEQRIAADPVLAKSVTLRDSVSRSEIPGLLARTDVVVSPNEPRSGATFDKAVFEAAACARPVISTNPAFAGFLSGTGAAVARPAAATRPPSLLRSRRSHGPASTRAARSAPSCAAASSATTRSSTGPTR